MITPKITPTARSQHQIRHRKENPTSVTALDPSSPYTPRLQRKKTTRWSIDGNRMLMGSSFS